MFKSLKLLSVAALAAVLTFGTANARGVVTNTTDQLFNAVDEISASLSVDPSANLSIFISGTYSVANRIVLQRELGGAGSGAWANVLTIPLNTANLRETHSFTSGPGPETYRLNMTATGTGDVVAYLTDAATVAPAMLAQSNADTVVFFDDFQTQNQEGSLTALDAEVWVSQEDGGGTLAVYDPSNREGGVSVVTDGGAGDATCFGLITQDNFAALISDGGIVFETRVATDQNASGMFAGVADGPCVATNLPMMIISSLAVTGQATGFTSIAGLAFDDNATQATSWQALSTIANDVEGANALAVPVGTIPSASTYTVLRVEVDATGDAYFYVSNALVHAEPLAMGATTLEVMPLVQTVDSGAATNMIIDYMYWARTRPTAPST